MKIIFLLLFLLYIPRAFGEYNTWAGLSHTEQISKRYSFLAQGQLRGDSSFKLIETQSRVGILYNLKKSLKLGGGIFGSLDEQNSFREFRPWQQVVYKKDFNSFIFSGRFRQEQRLYTQDETLAHRTRILVQASKIFNNKEFYVANETMFGLNSVPVSDVKKGINQNRVHFGVKIKMSANEELNLAWRYINRYYDNLATEEVHVFFIQIRTK